MEKNGLCTLKSNTNDTDINKINMNTGNRGEKVTQYDLAQINAQL